MSLHASPVLLTQSKPGQSHEIFSCIYSVPQYRLWAQVLRPQPISSFWLLQLGGLITNTQSLDKELAFSAAVVMCAEDEVP